MSASPRADWFEAPLLASRDGWELLEESGFLAAIGWFVPAGCLGRVPLDDRGRTVRIVEERDDGGRVEYREPFTAADRAAIDDGIDEYLLAAGIPRRPPGFLWLIRSRPGDPVQEHLVARIGNAILDRGGSDPRRFADDVAAVLPALFPGC